MTTLPSSCADVMESGNLNFLEPSGPLQACNGTALPLPLTNQTKRQNKMCVRNAFCKVNGKHRYHFQSTISDKADHHFTGTKKKGTTQFSGWEAEWKGH